MRLDDNGLLEALHDGMFQTPLWGDFLERLRTKTGARHTNLSFRPIDEESIVMMQSGQPLPDDLSRSFLENYSSNPSTYRKMREGRVYTLEELLDREDPAQERLYVELMAPNGLTAMRSVRVTEASGIDLWLGVAGGKSIGAGTSALLSALVPHLRIALRSYIALEREKFRSNVSAQTFDRLDAGWMTLDARGRIVDMTRHVEQLLQRTNVLRRGRYDRLTPASPAIDRELTSLIKQYSKDGEGPPKAINLSRDPWMDMLVSPLPRKGLASGATPVAIVYVSGDRRSSADRREQLVELFGLLPSEARLAWVLAQGVSIADAAEAVGISVETARNYSKKIYAKTGARGHPELVRIILTSVLTIT